MPVWLPQKFCPISIEQTAGVHLCPPPTRSLRVVLLGPVILIVLVDFVCNLTFSAKSILEWLSYIFGLHIPT